MLTFTTNQSAALKRRFSIISQLGVLVDTPAPSLLFRYLLETISLTLVYFVIMWMVVLRSNQHLSVWLSVPFYGSILYLCFVLFMRNLMEKRPPISARVFEGMVVFHGYQTVLNLLCFILMIQEYQALGLSAWGNGEESIEGRWSNLGVLIWINYANKYVELLDTLFSVLRKKFTQISFLHVYQRVAFIWLWFWICSVCPGGDFYFGAFLNFFVNILTYGFSMLTLIGIKFPISWKYRISDIHILQYVLSTLYSVLMIFDIFMYKQSSNLMLAVFQMILNFTMLVLFTNFHFEHVSHKKERCDSPVTGRLIFSFDSSGWLYLYHFGIAKFIETNFMKDPHSIKFGFSGSSGGSLVAAALAGSVDIKELATYVMKERENCKFNPWKILPAAERALDKFLKEDSHVYCTDRLRVLVTKVTTSPPFLMGEVKSKFTTKYELWHSLRASCHVPMIGGLLPYSDGKGRYFDGLFWSSNLSFVPWRSFTEHDHVFRVSSVSNFAADIKPRMMGIFPFPTWWSLFPPEELILEGMAARGFLDAKKYFLKSGKAIIMDSHMGKQLNINWEEVQNTYWKDKAYDEMIIRKMEGAVWLHWMSFAGILSLSIVGVVIMYLV